MRQLIKQKKNKNRTQHTQLAILQQKTKGQINLFQQNRKTT